MKKYPVYIYLFLALSLLVFSGCSQKASASPMKSSAQGLRIQTPEDSGAGIITYVDEGNLWMVRLWFVDGTPTIQERVQLTADSGISWAKLAPDGTKVAYVRDASNGTNALHIVDLATYKDTPIFVSSDIHRIDTVQWMPNSDKLAFNRYGINELGKRFSVEDLTIVDQTAEPAMQFNFGEAGGAFAISPDQSNTILFIREVDELYSELVRTKIYGGLQESLFEFKTIYNEDGSVEYPQPIWAADDTLAYVTVPEKSDDITWRTTALWRVPEVGDAQLLAMMPGRMDNNKIAWSTKGERIAYVQSVTERNHELFVSNGNSVETYEGSGNISILDWHENGEHFLYTRNNIINIGRQAEPPTKIPVQMVNTIASGTWIDAKSFMIISGTEQAWEIGIGGWTGNYEPLLITRSEKPIADVWRQKPPPRPVVTPTPLPTETPLPTATPWPTATATPWPTQEVLPTQAPPTATWVPPTAVPPTPVPQPVVQAPVPQAAPQPASIYNPNVMPPLYQMPILATYYNPVLGGINCDSNCSVMADNRPWSSADYGKVAACIQGWHYNVVVIDQLGSFLCRDRGGAIVVEFNQYYQQWVIHIDILLDHEPYWNYWLFYNWSLQ